MADTVIVRSAFLTTLELAHEAVLLVHGLNQKRLVVASDVVELVAAFDTPRSLEAWARDVDPDDLACVRELLRDGMLFDTAKGDEAEHYRALYASNLIDPEHARAPRADREVLFDVRAPRAVASYRGHTRAISVVFFGLCNVQVGMDVFRQAASEMGIEATVHGTFFDDLALLREVAADAIVVGHFPERHAVLGYPPGPDGAAPPELYGDRLRAFLGEVRAISSAPVFVDNFPVPTASPLGLADRGPRSHRNRARAINAAIEEACAEVEDTYVVDVDAAWSLHGKWRLVDDSLASFSHLGSLYWILHQAEALAPGLREIAPPVELAPAHRALEPFEPERLVALEQLAAVQVVLGIGRRKCVVVDLDNTLWPGVLADRGEAFPPGLESSFPHVVFRGVHEALLALKERGVLLACVSKNDESVVRSLWKPREGGAQRGFLQLDDFVTHRISWNEKVDGLRDIARELNLGLDALVFVDDNPIERAKVEQHLPQVAVLGANPFTVRWELLTSPALQVPSITDEARARTPMVKAQILRERERSSAVSPSDFLRSLGLRCSVERLVGVERLERVHELVVRTNQFNTTSRRYTKDELVALVHGPDSAVYVLDAEDKFTHYGLVAVGVVVDGVIELFVMSCRVIGLGVEGVLLGAVLDDWEDRDVIEGRYVAGDRNMPARNLFADHGFTAAGDGRWTFRRAGAPRRASSHAAVTLAHMRRSASRPGSGSEEA